MRKNKVKQGNKFRWKKNEESKMKFQRKIYQLNEKWKFNREKSRGNNHDKNVYLVYETHE